MSLSQYFTAQNLGISTAVLAVGLCLSPIAKVDAISEAETRAAREDLRTNGPIILKCDPTTDFERIRGGFHETKCDSYEASQRFLKPFSKVKRQLTRS